MNRTILLAAAIGLGLAGPASAASQPSAIVDPPRDSAFPAHNQQLLIPSHGLGMNALLFVASGKGPHRTVVLMHGLPGNERNLDLAQAVRRAGWNVLTFTYRGAWGGGGDFSISNAIEGAGAALDFLRSEEASRRFGVNRSRLVIAGQSMGGYAAAAIAADDALGVSPSWVMSRTGETMSAERDSPELAGLILLDAWNIAGDATQPRAALIAGMDDFGRALHGATPESVADEVIANGRRWSLPALAPQLSRTRILTIYATHGGAAENRVAAEAMRRAGAQVTAREIDSDHPFADHR